MRCESKGQYPWRLGATSYVVPAGLMDNVRLLADRVDDVQLLFFESAAGAGLEHGVDVGVLARLAAEHDLSYTVHLPLDLRLGAADAGLRQQGQAEILRLVAELESLGPLAYDLHLEQEPDLEEARWLQNLEQSLGNLAAELGPVRRRLAVENIGYPFSIVWPLVRDFGFSVCLDLGHARRDHSDWREIMGLLPQASHIHYHGVCDGKDHKALAADDDEAVRELGAALSGMGFDGVVTLELYNMNDFEMSLPPLTRGWQQFARNSNHD